MTNKELKNFIEWQDNGGEIELSWGKCERWYLLKKPIAEALVEGNKIIGEINFMLNPDDNVIFRKKEKPEIKIKLTSEITNDYLDMILVELQNIHNTMINQQS